MKNERTVSTVVLILILLGLSVYFYKDTISLLPAFIHAWSQGDRYALALGFIDNGFDFFHPTTYNLDPIYPSEKPLVVRKGITGVDFPVHEFIIAVFMKVLGNTSPLIFRLYILSYSLIGLYFIFLLTKNITQSNIKGIFAVLFVFTAPVFTYYQAGFIPSIPSFSNAIIGCYFFYMYKNKSAYKYLYLCLLFLTIAALARTPFVIILLALFGQGILTYLATRKFNTKEIFAYSLSFTVIIAYSLYNTYLSSTYGSLFLREILPAGSIAELKEIIRYISNALLFHYFSLYHYVALGIVLILTLLELIKKKRWQSLKQNHMVQFICIAGTGAAAYFLVMAKQFVAHDYYFIDSFFPSTVLLFVYCLKYVPIRFPIYKYSFIAIALLFTLAFVRESKGIQVQRYTYASWDRTETTRQNFIHSDIFLDSLHIPRTAKILVIDAYSANIPLILLDRKGYTVLTTSRKNIDKFLLLDFDYIVMQDQFIIADVVKGYPEIIDRLNRIGGNGKISVYALEKQPVKKTLMEFLGIRKENAILSSSINFDSNDPPYWNRSKTTDLLAFSPPTSALMEAGIEFGTAFKIKAKELKTRQVNQLLFEGQFLVKEGLKDTYIVVSITSKNEQVYYTSFNLHESVKPQETWQNVHFLFVLPSFKTENDELVCYIWNPNQTSFFYDNLAVGIY